ncbi:hypothetical protein V6O07_01615, partial [Arthrospira platensis SPKY2]
LIDRLNGNGLGYIRWARKQKLAATDAVGSENLSKFLGNGNLADSPIFPARALTSFGSKSYFWQDNTGS